MPTPFDHNVHHRGHCAAAACGSLKPLPAERLRGTYPHQLSSYALLGLTAFRAHGARSRAIRMRLAVVLDKQLDAFADRYEPVPELTPDEKAEREAEKAEAEFSGIGDASMSVIFSYT